jgi:hypothetical protein
VKLAAEHYRDIPGNWSSNIVATFRRAEADSVLPSGMSAAVENLNRIRVHAHVIRDEVVPIMVALQYVNLAYRVAHYTVHGMAGAEHSDSRHTSPGAR